MHGRNHTLELKILAVDTTYQGGLFRLHDQDLQSKPCKFIKSKTKEQCRDGEFDYHSRLPKLPHNLLTMFCAFCDSPPLSTATLKASYSLSKKMHR